MSGTFIFQFDSTDSNYANQVTSNLPVINTSGSFTTLTPSLSTNGSTTTVTVTYAYTTISDEDGCSFNYVANYFNDANISNIQITNFGGIPLSKSGYQFAYLNNLVSIATLPTILSGTSAEGMFGYTVYSAELDLSMWNMVNVTNMSYMFDGSAITSVGDLSSWNVANVTNMSYMFQSYTGTSVGDLSSWNVANVTNMDSMFSNAGITTIGNVRDNWSITNVVASNGYGNFARGSPLSGNSIPNWHFGRTITSGTFEFLFDSTDSNYANQVVDNLPIINSLEIFTALTPTLSTSGSSTTVSVSFSNYTVSSNNGLSFANVLSYFNDARISNIQITNFGSILLSNSGNQFHNLNYLTSVTTSSSPTILTGTTVTNMFNSCIQLTTLDLSNWDTSGITDMSLLFYNCQTIASINVSNWNTSNVTTMNDMFFTCPVLETINGLSGWNVANVTNMSNMFTQCYLLSSLDDVSGWNVSNVTNMSGMFSVLSAITSLDLSTWNVSKVTNMSAMFNGSSGLTSIGNVSGWNVSNVTNLSDMFSTSGITSLNVSNWNVSNCIIMLGLFHGCSGLTSLDLSNWNVTNALYMNNMFSECANLISIGNVRDNWNVTNVVANNDYSDFATFSQLTGNSIPNWANPPTSPPPSPPTGNVCFPAGTPVTTDQGIVPIQDIIPTVHTIRKQPILAITRTALKDDYMVCFEKDSIMKNVPSERTVISPQHKLFYNGHMIEAQYFPSEFDRVTIISYSGEPVYNVLLLDHSKMIVNNMITETLDPENTVAELYRLYENPTRKDQEEYIHIQESYLRTMIELKQTLCKISC